MSKQLNYGLHNIRIYNRNLLSMILLIEISIVDIDLIVDADSAAAPER